MATAASRSKNGLSGTIGPTNGQTHADGVSIDRARNGATPGTRFTPAPDSLFDKARQEAEYTNKLDPRQQALGGLETPAGGMATPLADLKQIGEARGTVLGVKLDQVRTRPHCHEPLSASHLTRGRVRWAGERDRWPTR